MNTSLTCPFRNCGCYKQRKRGVFATLDSLRNHVEDKHSGDIKMLDHTWFTSHDLHLCYLCKSRIFLTHRQLALHRVRAHHSTQDDPNSTIFHNLFNPTRDSPYTNKWPEAVPWIAAHTAPTPTSFRQSLWDKTPPNQKHIVATILCDLFSILPTCHHRLDRDTTGPEWDTTPWWWLIIHLEQLLLAPSPKESRKETHIPNLIRRRISMFRSGWIQALYDEAHAVTSLTQRERENTLRHKPPSVTEDVLHAANNNNFKSAYNRLCKDTPVASVHQDNIQYIQALFPPATPSTTPSARRTTRASSQQARPTLQVVDIFKSILKHQRGKAPGLLNDSIDLFIYTANELANGAMGDTQPQVLDEPFQLLMNGDVPRHLQPLLCATFLLALRKDPSDDTKLRPIGIPSALRRILAAYITRACNVAFCTFMLPYNYAGRLGGGMHFVCSAIQQACETYISIPQSQHRSPSRCIISLDIRNMFNAVSRQRLREIIRKHFPLLTTFIEFIYGHDFDMYLRDADGIWRTIPVQEGFTQGCPLSPILAAIVLKDVLSHLDSDLRARARARLQQGNPGDDGHGGITDIFAFVDDTNAAVPLEDVLFFLQRFQDLATPVNAILNADKTRILTSTTNSSAIPSISRDHGQAIASQITAAINSFSVTTKTRTDGTSYTEPVEVTNGLRILGVPIGSPQFCATCVRNTLRTIMDDCNTILRHVTDRQLALRLFSQCTITKIPHLLPCVATFELNATDAPQPWHQWTSPITNAVHNIEKWFIATLLSCPTLEDHSIAIAHLPIGLGGLGILHAPSRVVPDLVLRVARAISFCTQGIRLTTTGPPITLPTSIARLFSSWRTSPTSLCITFRQYAPEIAQYATPTNLPGDLASNDNEPPGHTPPLTTTAPPDERTDYLINTMTPSRARDNINTAAHSERRQALIDHDDIAIRTATPGLLQPHTSAPIIAMSRISRAHRLDNDLFIIATRRKLRIPIFDSPSNPPICACGKQIDKHGDHLFSCVNQSKKRMHDRIRDLWAPVLRRILREISFIHGDRDIGTEWTDIVSFAPLMRPYDIGIIPDTIGWRRTYSTFPCRMIGIDVTIAPLRPSSSSTASSADNNLLLQETHLQTTEKRKLQRAKRISKDSDETIDGEQVIADLLDQNHALIPGAVDGYGDLGPCLKRLFFGTRPKLPPPTFTARKQHSKSMFHKVYSDDIPEAILTTANKVWATNRGGATPATTDDRWYGDSYIDATPSTWAMHQIGLAVVDSLASHIKQATFRFETTPGTGTRRPSPNLPGAVGAGTWPSQPSTQEPRPHPRKTATQELAYSTIPVPLEL